MITGNRTPKQTAWYRTGILFFIIAAAVCSTLIFAAGGDFTSARQEIVLRKIGHDVLLQSGDSTSRILPIQQLSSGRYQIRFEHPFTFQTDSLVSIVRRSLKEAYILPNYIVYVKSCDGREVFYGFTVAEHFHKSIIPCLGRIQPRGCYLIELQLTQEAMVTVKRGPLVAGLSILAFIGLVIASPFRIRKRRIRSQEEQTGIILLGDTQFDPVKATVMIAGIVTELTPKENRLLKILADNKNVIIERARLQKELWEDEGVIVGRSLDVFISKLRKKLENDKSIQLKNIHGKGYKLEL